MTLNKLALIAATILLAILGCAGNDWFIHGHKNFVVCFAAFAAACYTLSLSWPWFSRSPKSPKQP